MTFAKGNTLWKRGLEVRKQNKGKPDDLMQIFIDGSFEKYMDLQEKLYNGEEVTKEQREYMDRLEKNFPYRFAKRANVDDKGDSVSEVTIKIERDYGDNPSA